MLKILLNVFLKNFRVASLFLHSCKSTFKLRLSQKKDQQHNVWIYFPKKNKEIKIVMTISSKAILDNNALEDKIKLAKT